MTTAAITVPPTRAERVYPTVTAVVPPIRGLDHFDASHPVDGVGAGWVSPGAMILEARASNAIEGIHTSVTQAALAVLQPRHDAVTTSGRTVAGLHKGVRAAFAGEVTYDSFSTAQRTLMVAQGTPWHAGLRTEVVAVGGYVAPAPSRVSGLLDDLAGFASRSDRVVDAAIAHAQFEAIHPFPDGNGRIGRALLSAHLGIPVSPYLLPRRQEYYAALAAYRAGDTDPIVTLVGAAADYGFDLIEQTSDYSGVHSPTLTVQESELIPLLTERPVGTKRRILGAASTRREDAFDRLIRSGGLQAVSGHADPDTVYAYTPIVLTWQRLSPVSLRGTHYEGKWKKDIHV